MKTQKNKIEITIMVATLLGLAIIGNRAVALEKTLDRLNDTQITPIIRVESNRATKLSVISTSTSKHSLVIAKMGEMGKEFEEASKEFNVPLGLMIGIANAESGIGKNFYNQYDKENCHNWVGLKGGQMKNRKDGSWLRCFTDEESGARTFAKTLRLYYLNEGRTTPETIANKWVGKNQSAHHKVWVSNVNKYFN